jgi:hypothetical protein
MAVESSILKGPASPYVLPETPWVQSIGRRVMQMGYSFVWIANTPPWLVSPDGCRSDLELHGNIPSLRIGDATEEAMVAKAVPRVSPTPAEQEDSEEEVGAPVKVRPCSGCTNSKSAFTQKESVVILDPEEDVSETNTDTSSDSDTEKGEEDSAEQGSLDLTPTDDSKVLPSCTQHSA